MKHERIGSLIHNARNRLTGVIDRLAAAGEQAALADELHTVAGQLACVMALLRLDDGEAAAQHEIDLEAFFADLAAESRRLTPAHLHTQAAADFSASLFPFWTFDGQLIRLVLLDALMNAWRHARLNVRLDARCVGNELHFIIRDDGPGFPAAWLAAGQGDAAAVTPAPLGCGQGLQLARRIAAQHAANGKTGRIELENAADGGAVFRLILP